MTTKIIYLGGTFGCSGSPLSPLPPDLFRQLLSTFWPVSAAKPELVGSFSAKDSSELTYADFADLAEFIKNNSAELIITGTDTLAYLSSFLCLSGFKGVGLLASMTPLALEKPESKQALDTALASLATKPNQLRVRAGTQSLCPLCLTKAHSTSEAAFVDCSSFSTPCPLPALQRFCQTQLKPISANTNPYLIETLVLLPSKQSNLSALKRLATNPPEVLVVLGFGSGNWPLCLESLTLVQQLCETTLVVVSSQALLGGASFEYSAAAELKHTQVVGMPLLSLPALVSLLTLICMTHGTLEHRRQTTKDAAAHVKLSCTSTKP